MQRTQDNVETKSRVPVWVPDESDPEGLQGRWQFVDPDASDLTPELAAQAHAVAEQWETARQHVA
jgi:hypothetical protein